MARILITGALGHIGSKFIHQISIDQFDEVVLIDNLATQRYTSLFDLPSGIKFRFLEEDVLTAPLTERCKGIDVVLHLAAITNAEGSFDIQEKVEAVNYDGTKKVAEACLATGARLIFLSTTSVYGTQENVVDENCPESDLKPQSPYASSKLKAEKLLEQMGKKGLKYVTCRFGTIFGVSKGMRFHTAVNKFVWQASMGLPITVWRTALHQKRPYLHLGDAIRALAFIMEKNLFDNKVYNVLTTNSTVNDIVEVIKSYVPDINVEYVDSRIMNQLSYTVSADKFKSLGFTYRGTLRDGIQETVKLLAGVRRTSKD